MQDILNDKNKQIECLEAEIAGLKRENADLRDEIEALKEQRQDLRDFQLKEQDNYPNMESDGWMTDRNHRPD
jgi:predicted  nucleic acid-binding Zn-ribbon protein